MSLAIVAGLFFVLSPCFCQVPAPASAPSPSVSASPAPGQQPPQAAAQRPCNGRNSRDCGVSKEDLKKARRAFERGNRLKATDLQQALDAFEEAVQLVPRSPEYATAREIVRQQLIYDHLRVATRALSEKRTVESTREFQKALELDPENQTALAGLREIARDQSEQTRLEDPFPQYEDTTVRPKPVRQTFHLSGDTRMAFSTVTRAFGIKADFDPSIRSGVIRLDLEQAEFDQAMQTLCALTRTFWTPVSSSQVLVAADTPTAHRELDRWLQRTFYLPEFSSAEDLNNIVNLLRSVFELRRVTQQPATSTVTVRGPAPVVKAATAFLNSLAPGRPEVMIDFEVFQINRQMLQTFGVDMPLQFNIFNIPQSALAALGNQNIQNLINQLMASGGLTEANMASISALIAQLQNQQSTLSSLFANPVATFGGGSTLMGIGVPPATVHLSRNDARMTSLEHVTLRASQANAATLRLGTRYPILNAAYSSVYNFSQLTGSSSLVNAARFPSFSYEDLGIILTAKPAIHGTTTVTLDLDVELRSLGGTSFNDIPIINQRAYKGVITLKDGESAVVAGAVTQNEQKSLTGIPGIARLPVLGPTASSHDTTHEKSELLIVVTPHIIRTGPPRETSTIVVPFSSL